MRQLIYSAFLVCLCTDLQGQTFESRNVLKNVLGLPWVDDALKNKKSICIEVEIPKQLDESKLVGFSDTVLPVKYSSLFYNKMMRSGKFCSSFFNKPLFTDNSSNDSIVIEPQSCKKYKALTAYQVQKNNELESCLIVSSRQLVLPFEKVKMGEITYLFLRRINDVKYYLTIINVKYN
ncbi:hypothetical protein QTN47_22610 [Danxiaibacter flavus]|uniref:Uncharacterized protein n=1 Tax=Danxiaibacter flavus TaxID=3049108 RepID=A0ABV3ZL94_9BACT|nr:hypothetical protein QNM32_22615 [Chitinophagaceae bacterium DXS]